nr:hypothetical protein [Bacillota bacterium]
MKRRNRHPRRDSRTGFSIFIIVIILAIAAGYAGTKYIIFPYLLGNDKAAESGKQSGVDETVTGSGVDVLPDTPSVIIDQQNLTNDAGDKGNTDANKENTDPNKGNTVVNNGVAAAGAGPFCVQFGSFSTKEGAD